jgi:hypothetical protein
MFGITAGTISSELTASKLSLSVENAAGIGGTQILIVENLSNNVVLIVHRVCRQKRGRSQWYNVAGVCYEIQRIAGGV